MPTPKGSKIAQYADDTMLYTQKKQTTTLTKTLQNDLETINHWFKKWKIKINKKTVAIRFSLNKKRQTPPQIHINNTKIEWQKEVKYLGITMDLTYKNHIKQTRKNATAKGLTISTDMSEE